MTSSIKVMVQNGTDGDFSQFEIWVKPEFLTLCDVKTIHLFDMMKDYDLWRYLHNENGPALINHMIKGETVYILNGKPATEEETQQIKLKEKINTKV